ncbi:MAG: acyl-ACP--UDP-N-acetylglucosamine O-acyltransferase [Planctomycetota bacterium]
MIHNTAIVDPRAEIDREVDIGPYAIIGPSVKIARGCRIGHHATIEGRTTIDEECNVFPYASLGTIPQDLTFHGEMVYLTIGKKTIIREYVTINCGTEKGGNTTRIGSANLIMAYCHIAHDCEFEDGIVVANACQFGGHVKVEKHATFGGMAAIHHFVTVGEKAFVGGLSRIVHDVPPYLTVEGNPARVRCLNNVGLHRRGFTKERVQAIKEAYKIIWRSGLTRKQAFQELEAKKLMTPEVTHLVEFMHATEDGRQGRAREAFRRDQK